MAKVTRLQGASVAGALWIAVLTAVPAAAEDLTVLFTGDVRGSYAGCDCRDQPLGGVAQRAFLVGEVRRSGVPTLVLDAGNLLFRSPLGLGDDAEAWRRADAMLLMDAYALMGVDAVNVGPHDLAAGLEYLQKLQGRSAFPLLSTNLVDPETGRPVFTPVLHLDRAGVRAVVIGLLPGDMEGRGYRTSDPVATAKAAVADARDQGAELIILLSALDPDTEAKLARRVRGVDLILSSGKRARTDAALWIRDAAVVHAGGRGKYVGRVTYDRAARGRDRLAATTMPVETGGPVDEDVFELVQETELRHQSPEFLEAGKEAVPP